jgi:hypothetical protein
VELIFGNKRNKNENNRKQNKFPKTKIVIHWGTKLSE